MENIIQKAIEGGYRYKGDTPIYDPNEVQMCIFVCDPLFWKALSKACGWDGAIQMGNRYGFRLPVWKHEALKFHEINLHEGWSQAIKYLEDLIKQNI